MDDEITWADLLTVRDFAEMVLAFDARAPEWVERVDAAVLRETRSVALSFRVTGLSSPLLVQMDQLGEIWHGDGAGHACAIVFDLLRERLP